MWGFLAACVRQGEAWRLAKAGRVSEAAGERSQSSGKRSTPRRRTSIERSITSVELPNGV